MAIIDYKDKYEKAVQAAMLAKQDTESAVTIGILEEIFPELRESEDERIRKEMITYFSTVEDKELIPYESWIAYLEKQGEQKPAELIKEYDFHGVKFIPKFAKGDIIRDKKRGKVSTIKDFSYDTGLYTNTYGQFPITIQDNYELIEQKPIDKIEPKFKIGDIIIKYSKTPCPVHSSTDDTLCIVASVLDKHYILVTNEGKIQVSFALQDYYELVQPKQEWDKEDEQAIEDAESWLDMLCGYLKNNYSQYIPVVKEVISKLKSLRPQSTWKPSEEQMKALKHASNDCSIAFADMKILATLYEQLKALHRYEQDT